MDKEPSKPPYNVTASILAVGIMLGFFACLGTLLFRDIPQSGHDVLLVMIGVLGASMTAIMGYHFGSSAGSEKSKDTLNTMINKTSTVIPEVKP